jgi:hypothetical protein
MNKSIKGRENALRMRFAVGWSILYARRFHIVMDDRQTEMMTLQAEEECTNPDRIGKLKPSLKQLDLSTDQIHQYITLYSRDKKKPRKGGGKRRRETKTERLTCDQFLLILLHLSTST